jgi:flagellar basal-body rod protein FlgF
MENLSYIGLSQQTALQHQMEIVANNIANMNTPGYKSQSLLFKEYVNPTTAEGEKISQVQDYGSYRNLMQGPVTQTGNSLDVALDGKGYFAVQTPQGIRYTRDGSFSLDSAGELVTKAGYRVMGDGNSPITIQQGAGHITIMGDGNISTELGSVGKLKVSSFATEQSLIPIGNNLFDAQSAAEQPVEAPHLMQGALEGSNVQAITEMNHMIEISRLYQSVQHMLMTDHDQARAMIQHLTQV